MYKIRLPRRSRLVCGTFDSLAEVPHRRHSLYVTHAGLQMHMPSGCSILPPLPPLSLPLPGPSWWTLCCAVLLLMQAEAKTIAQDLADTARLEAARQDAVKQELAEQAAAKEEADRQQVAHAAKRANEAAEKRAKEGAATRLARRAEENKRVEREIEFLRREREDRRRKDTHIIQVSKKQVRRSHIQNAKKALFSCQGVNAAVHDEPSDEDMSFLHIPWPSPPRGRLEWCDDEELRHS